MALRIRLRRMGRKKAPHYRIVVAEASMPRDGRFVDRVGHYNPRTDPMTLVVDQEKARLWLSRGAKPTETVDALFRRAGVYRARPAESVVEAVQTAAGRANEGVAGPAAAAAETAAGAAETVREAVAEAVEQVAGGEAEEEPRAE